MKKTLFTLALICNVAFLSACGNHIEINIGSVGDYEQTEDHSYLSEGEECFVSFTDGNESYDLSVNAYGNEVKLPDPMGSNDGGEFVGWLTHTGLFCAGDMVVSEEFMSFSAIYTTPTDGLFIILDSMGNGYSVNVSEEEEFIVDNPYTYDYSFNNFDYYIDYYVDDVGNRYDFDETVKIGRGEYLILTTAYSEDLSGANKVSISYNAPVEDGLFDEASYRYVKKGESIPIESMIEYDGFTIDGWFDDPEGGNLICGNGELYTPIADIELFAHWTAI